jgi:rare lipoprotein A
MSPVAFADCGKASWYGSPHEGRKTASGEVFRSKKYTAAHRSLPFGTKLRVTYKNKSVIVKVNDRGPFTKGRVIDLSKAAAESLGMKSAGVAKVCFEKIKP